MSRAARRLALSMSQTKTPVDPSTLSARLGARNMTGLSSPASNPAQRSVDRFRAQVRSRSGRGLTDSLLHGLAAAGRLTPVARPERHQVEVISDVPYQDGGSPDHTLDIYRPTIRPGPWPVVFYVHGGGFTLLSKDTHWIMALSFARMGYLVFNISYRLAPRHPYPAAIADTCAAYEWVVKNAAAYGGDTSRLAVAGESAGANLVTALSVATSYRRDEPFARRAYDAGVTPRVAMPACGMLQVSDASRFSRRRRLPAWIDVVLTNVSQAYLHRATPSERGDFGLADPLLLLEEQSRPDRPLPAFFVPVGTRDPLLDDTRRLQRALERQGVECLARYYHKEIHAFHALVWRRRARRCWEEAFAFLDRHLRPERAAAAEPAGGATAA